MNSIVLTIVLTFFIIINILYYLIIFHIILSWISLLGISLKIKFVEDILGPIYKFVSKIFPTRIGPFDLTPIIVIFALLFIRGLIMLLFPEISTRALNLLY